MTAPNDLVRGLRYRRWLGRQQLVRGTTPTRPRIKSGLAPGTGNQVPYPVVGFHRLAAKLRAVVADRVERRH